MRTSSFLFGGIAALGLMTAVAVQSGQAAESQTSVPHPTNGDSTLSAWQADLAWRDASMDSDTDLELILNSGEDMSASAVARLAAIWGFPVLTATWLCNLNKWNYPTLPTLLKLSQIEATMHHPSTT